MKLRTRILLVSGSVRYSGATALMLAGFLWHPAAYFLALAWLVGCCPALRYVVLPPLFQSTRCPNASCRRHIELYAIWKCRDHFTDCKPRHVCVFRCDKGHEIEKFNCPFCGTTIQVQKEGRRTEKATISDSVSSSGAKQDTTEGFLIGYNRRHFVGWFMRLLRKIVRRPMRTPVALPDEVIGRHVALLGGTGMGKSTLIINLAKQIFERGEGATFLDPSGDLAKELLKHVPRDRIEARDVLYINVKDETFPFPLNLIHAHDRIERKNIIDELLSIMKSLYPKSWGDNIALQLRSALRTVLEFDGSLQDVYDLFNDSKARYEIVRRIKDENLKDYWTNEYKPASRSAVLNKLDPIVNHPYLGPILCSRHCAFDADTIIAEKKIVIVNLSTGSPSDAVSALLGTFVVNKIVAAAYRQEALAEEDRVRHFFFVDEFQNFMHRSNAFHRILSEVRKYRLALIVANQFVEQLEKVVRAAIFGNVGCLTVFRVGHADAGILKDEFDGAKKRDLMRLDKGECLTRIGIDYLSIRTPRKPDPTEYDDGYQPADAIKRSMQKLVTDLRDDRPGKQPGLKNVDTKTDETEEGPAPRRKLCQFV